MLWLNKITSGIKTLLKEHLISIVVFLVGMILAGIETDYIENLFIDLPIKAFQDELLFGTCFCLFLTPGILLVESHFKNKKQKIIHVLELLISIAVSGIYSWAETIGNKLEDTPYADYEQYLTRAAIVYLILAVACTVYFLYKKSGETFEGYFYKAFVGVIRAVVIYIIMAIGILLIMHIFESLFFTTRLELLPEFVLMGIVGFPAGIYGISHVEEGDSGFSKVLFCYTTYQCIFSCNRFSEKGCGGLYRQS